LLKVAGASYQRATTLMQDVGYLPRDLGVLRVQEPGKVSRIPSCTELHERWRGIVVNEDELVSEAEMATRFGDSAAAEAAAREAKG
jgi:hypothetical protein